MKSAVIISGNLAQDHEFIYPYYRLLEEGIEVDVCLLEGKFVQGILGTTLPPNKDQKVKKIDERIKKWKENTWNFGNRLLVIHTGGHQSISGINQRLAAQGSSLRWPCSSF